MSFENVTIENLSFWITILVLVSVGGYTLWFFFVKNLKKFGTHEIVAISHRHYVDNLKTGEEELKLYKYQKGGDSRINPLTQSYRILPANQITLEIESENIRTNDDFFTKATTIVIFSIDSSTDLSMEVAFKLFGHLANTKIKIDDFKKGVLEILEPLVSSETSRIVGKLDYEELKKDEDRFNEEVKNAIEEKLIAMGLIVTSITLKDFDVTNSEYKKMLENKKHIEIQNKMNEDTAKAEQIKADRELENEKYKLEIEKILSEERIEKERFELDKELEKEKYIAKQKIEKEKQDLENARIILEQKIEQERFESEKILEQEKQKLENEKILREQNIDLEVFESEKKLEKIKRLAKQNIEKEKYDLENAKILQEAKIEKEKYDLESERVLQEKRIDLERFKSEKELEKERYRLEQEMELKEKELEKDNIIEQKKFEYEMISQKQDLNKQQIQQEQEFLISSQDEEQRIKLSKIKQDRIIAEQDIIEKEEEHNIKLLRAKKKSEIIVQKELKEITGEIELKEIELLKEKKEIEAEIELKNIEISQKRDEINLEIESKEIEVSHKRNEYQLDLEDKKVQISISDKKGNIEADNKINLRTFIFRNADKKRQAKIESQNNSHRFLSTVFKDNPSTVKFFIEKILKPKSTLLDVKNKVTKSKETKELEAIGDRIKTVIENDTIA